jgi:putative ABC transport system ATP-binding protein
LIQLNQVVKTYHSTAGSFTALKGIDLQVHSGEFVSIVGKSGSGKTTLINVLTGIDRPTQGEIYVADTPVHTLNEGQLAAWRGVNLGIVFHLHGATVLENVRLPMISRPAHARQRWRAMHRNVGIVDTWLPRWLSGSQQRAPPSPALPTILNCHHR